MLELGALEEGVVEEVGLHDRIPTLPLVERVGVDAVLTALFSLADLAGHSLLEDLNDLFLTEMDYLSGLLNWRLNYFKRSSLESGGG